MRIITNGNVASFTEHKKIVQASMYASTEGANICQPAIVRVPSWMATPLTPGATYYLMWSSHLQGDASYPVAFQHMKLLYTTAASVTASLSSPWTVYAPGTLTLAAVEAFGPYGHDAALAHIGFQSFEDTGSLIKMWTHARALTLSHATVYAESTDFINWTVLNGNVGGTDGIYLAIFKFGGVYYAVEESGILRRTLDAGGVTSYVRQADVETFRANMTTGISGSPSMRHCGVEVIGTTLHIYFTVRGDNPEQIYHMTADLTVPDWEDWVAVNRTVIAAPFYDFEGRFLNPVVSAGGPAPAPLQELRDPYPFTDPADGRRYLVYAAAAENSIGILPL